jgi:hypothetical protein
MEPKPGAFGTRQWACENRSLVIPSEARNLLSLALAHGWTTCFVL